MDRRDQQMYTGSLGILGAASLLFAGGGCDGAGFDEVGEEELIGAGAGAAGGALIGETVADEPAAGAAIGAGVGGVGGYLYDEGDE